MSLNMLKVIITETFKQHPQRFGPYIIIYPMPLAKFIIKPLVPMKQFCQRKIQFNKLRASNDRPMIFRLDKLQYFENIKVFVPEKAIKKK